MDKLLELCKKCAVSGYEEEFAYELKNELAQFCDEACISSMNNVVGVVNKNGKKRIMLEAHMDEVGLMVMNIDEKGFVKFDMVGGVDSSVLPSCEVVIHGRKKITGVIGAKPPHLMSAEESKTKYKIKELFIDCGYSKEELEEIISIGDMITFKADDNNKLLNDYFASKSIDNRMGVYVVKECLKRLKGMENEYTGLFATQEEVGLRGGKVGAYTINPDFAIVIDVTHGESPFVSKTEGYPLGGGVAIGKGPNLNIVLTNKLIECAKKCDIPYTIEALSGNSGTDAWVIQTTRQGIPCILVSVPIRYMHSTLETAKFSDIENAIELICKFLEESERNG